MSRLDVRVKTRLEATVVYITRKEQREETVSIRDLSLSGALVYGMSTELNELFSIRPVLPGIGRLELQGKIVRHSRAGTAIRIFYSDRHTMQSLWDYIKSNLEVGGSCPYCGHPENPGEGCCDKCNMYLNFRSEHYLERHIENTFAQRLNIRLSKLNLEHIQKIIQFVDSRFLKIQHRSPDPEFVGSCPAMLSVFNMIRKVATTEMNVLILGESGTGKELAAKSIHETSARKEGPFIAVNCAAIPETLLEAELFGYEKGAFTGAYIAKKGKFESADGGTLFLDEIGDLSPNLQAKLLRFLEDRLLERVGSSGSRKIDVRIVAATNSDLRKSMEEGKFRPDLYYRLNSFTINLPPLRDRGEDKVILAGYFLNKATGNGSGEKEFSEEALEAISMHSWPGNVRELENKVRRGVLMAAGARIDPDAMELDERNIIIRLPGLKSEEQKSQREIVSEVLENNDFVIARAARELNISRPSMYALMKKYGISGRSRE